MKAVVFLWVALVAAWGAAEEGARADEPADSAAAATPPQLRILIPARAGPVGALRFRPMRGQRPLLIIRGQPQAAGAPRVEAPRPDSGAATVEDLARLESRLIEYLDRRLGEPVLAEAPSMEPSVAESVVVRTSAAAEPLAESRSRSGPAPRGTAPGTTTQSTRVIPIVVPVGGGDSEEPSAAADTAALATVIDTTLAADSTVSDSVSVMTASPASPPSPAFPVSAADTTGLAAVVDEVETAFLDTELFRATGILFESNSADLLPASAVILSAVGTVLARYPEIHIEIRGHSDSRGADAYNLYLSELRAEAARAYLLSNFSIDASRLTARGYGESQPVASEDTPTGRALNRRVDFVVVR